MSGSNCHKLSLPKTESLQTHTAIAKHRLIIPEE